MKTKRILSILAACLISVASLYAADLTPEQSKFRSNLLQFLKEEGFSPTIDDDDNSINFKKEGILYWISVADSNPFYVELHRAGLNCKEADLGIILSAVNEGNKKIRSAKAILNSSAIVSFAVELYCHSAEEFRYIFYKSLKELEAIKSKVLDYYNENSEQQGSASSATSATTVHSADINAFFPVYGFTLGKVTSKELEAKGFTVKTIDSGAHCCQVRGLTFWDHNKDHVFEDIYIVHSDHMPDKWEDELGISWRLSYNQLLKRFRDLGFSVTVKKEPVTRTYSGRKTLSADVTVTSGDGHLVIDLDFDYGNSHGEGYSLTSPNSLYSMTIRTK